MLVAFFGPFRPKTNFPWNSSDTNLTRWIGPRHPEPPYTLITSNCLSSFFHFLGFGWTFQPRPGEWLGAAGGTCRGAFLFPPFKKPEEPLRELHCRNQNSYEPMTQSTTLPSAAHARLKHAQPGGDGVTPPLTVDLLNTGTTLAQHRIV